MSDGLGSLSQSARHSKLKSARIILFVVGGLHIVLHSIQLSGASREVDAVVRELQIVDAVEAEEARRTLLKFVKILYGVMIGLGVVYCVLGALVFVAPVACTLTGLILFVGVAAVLGVMHPPSLLHGIVLKVIFIVLLAQSASSAFAYQNERANQLKRERNTTDPDDFTF